MKVAFRKKLLVTLVASLWLPLAASAADADLMQKIEDLSRELQALKAQVTANEQKAAQAPPQASELADLKNQVTKLEGKSLSKWLTVGGDYRFRFDSLEGQSKTFTDVNATFMNAQNTLQSEFFANPSAASSLNPAWTTAQALSGLMGFSQAMGKVATYDQANAFLGANASMAGAMGAFAATVPAYKPKNTSQYSNRFGLDLGAKATQDISVNAHLNMYKVFGSQDEGPVTNAGSAPFFADRVGVFDGTLGHVPSNSALNVDRVYATWSNIGDEPVWLSVGRGHRPAAHRAICATTGQIPATAAHPRCWWTTPLTA